MQGFSGGNNLLDASRLLEILLPDGRGRMVALEAYLDESERPSGIFGVAGFGFVPPQAKKFSREWRQLFGDAGCHMVDLIARRGTFKGITQAESDRLLKEAVQIINRRMTVGVACSCSKPEILALFPGDVPLSLGRAYPLCCQVCIDGRREHGGQNPTTEAGGSSGCRSTDPV